MGVKHFLWFLFCCLPAALVAQTATFPGAVVTDPQMMVAGNNLNTTLLSPISSSATSATLLSSAGFQQNMLVSFSDSHEIAVICQVNGNTISFGYNGSCPSITGRGFDGTTATGHIPTAQVAGFYVAWHRNVDRVEIEAIENALGAGLSNVGSVKQVSAACGVAASPGPITTTGTLSLTDVTAAHNGSYAILTADCGKTLTSNTAAAWTIPQAGTAGFLAGWMVTVNNVGSGAITVTAPTSIFYGGPTANISGSVLTVPANTGALFFSDGTNYQVYVGGVGSGGGGGSVTNISTACGISGGPITTTGTVSTTELTAAHNGSYAVLTADCGKTLTSNTTAAWTIAQAGTTGFEVGKHWTINNVGSGNIVLTATTSTFYGGLPANIAGSVLTVPAFSGAYIFSDGTNYQVYTGSGASSSGGLGVNIQSLGAVPNTGADQFTAIQATINVVAAFPAGGTVFCPAGVYTISQALHWTADNVYFQGDGACVIQVRPSFTGNAGIVVGATSATITPTQLGGISGMTMDLTVNSTSSLIGIQLIQTWSMILNNVSIKNVNGLPTPIQTGLQLHSGALPGSTTAVIFAENNEIYNLRITGSFVYAVHHITGCSPGCGSNAQVNGTNYYGGSLFGDASFPAGTFGLKIDDDAGDTTRAYGLRLEDFDTCLYVGEQFNGPLDVRTEGCVTARYAGQSGIQYITTYNPVVTTVFTSPTVITNDGYFANNSSGVMTFNLPVITGQTLGHEYCFQQYFFNTAALTLQLPASTFLKVNGLASNPAGVFTSTGTAADSVCVVPINTSVYTVFQITGVWTGTAGTGSGAPGVFDSFASPVTVALQGTYDNRTGSTITYNLPTITGSTFGQEYCFIQYFSNTGAITLQLPASTFLMVNGVGTSPAGTFISGATAADSVCVTAINPLVYSAVVKGGTWSGSAGSGSTPPPPRAIALGIGAPGSGAALTTSSVSAPLALPFGCTLGTPGGSKYTLAIGTGDSGTFTVKFWKIAGGTAIPTSANSINTSGLSLSTGAVIQSATFTDFTSVAVTANDIMVMAVTAISGTIDNLTAVIPCQ